MKSLSLPTVDDPRDFYLGGLYAVVLFVLIILLFFQLLRGLDKMHSYAMTKSSAVSVSLVDVPLVTSKQNNTPKPVPKQEAAPEPTPEPEESPTPVEDISSLFSDIQTQKIVHTKRLDEQKKIDTKRLANLQKRIKTTKKRDTTATAEKVKNLNLVRPSQEAGGQSASGGAEVNAYYAKIQATIYENFFPPVNSEGSVSLIRIWISASGKMTRFKVLRPSGEAFFDREVTQLEQRLLRVRFERNPKGNEAVLDVSLVSKE
ncbi:TonB C-terminal domain-containing protein [Sulfurimonas diazotrophicus]|uniref:TonB C-terminal domain-containing protein n=1 Tax=Sulfurimonas diazotrophicus TaxID=3131939 RepID=A0ABZ3HDL1_9BACT